MNPNQINLSPQSLSNSSNPDKKFYHLKRFVGHLWRGATPRSFAAAVRADFAPMIRVIMNEGGPHKNSGNGGRGYGFVVGGYGDGRGGGYGLGGWGYGAGGGRFGGGGGFGGEGLNYGVG